MTIKALDALQKGYQRFLNARRVVLWLYALNLFTTLPLACGAHAVMTAAAGTSLAPSALLAGADFTIITDFLRAHGPALRAFWEPVPVLLLVYLLLNVFLSGGILLAVRKDGVTTTIPDFFAGCAAYFGRFLRLLLITGAGAAAIGTPVYAAVHLCLGALSAGANSEIPETIAAILRIVTVLLMAVPVLMVYDYARIDAVLMNSTSMRHSAWRGLRFVYRRLGRTVKMQLILLLLFALITALYLLIAGVIPSSSPLSIGVIVLVQQLYVLNRLGFRVFAFAAESALYLELNPAGGGIPGWEMGHAWN